MTLEEFVINVKCNASSSVFTTVGTDDEFPIIGLNCLPLLFTAFVFYGSATTAMVALTFELVRWISRHGYRSTRGLLSLVQPFCYKPIGLDDGAVVKCRDGQVLQTSTGQRTLSR